MSAETLLVGLTIFTAIPATCFPIFYGFGSPWWRSHLGRAVLIKGTGVMLLVDAGLLRLVVGDNSPTLMAVRLFVFILVPIGIWYQFIAFLLIKRKARREQQDLEMMMAEDHSS